MQERSGTVWLDAGEHHLRTEFFEHGGYAGLELKWEGPGLSKQTVPTNVLTRGSSDPVREVDLQRLVQALGANRCGPQVTRCRMQPGTLSGHLLPELGNAEQGKQRADRFVVYGSATLLVRSHLLRVPSPTRREGSSEKRSFAQEPTECETEWHVSCEECVIRSPPKCLLTPG